MEEENILQTNEMVKMMLTEVFRAKLLLFIELIDKQFLEDREHLQELQHMDSEEIKNTFNKKKDYDLCTARFKGRVEALLEILDEAHPYCEHKFNMELYD